MAVNPVTVAATAAVIGYTVNQITGPPKVETAPAFDDPAAKVKMQEAAAEQRRARGMAANILTSGGAQGLTDPPKTADHVLLGS